MAVMFQVVLVTACMLVIIFAVPSSAHEGEDATTEQSTLHTTTPSPDPLKRNLAYSLSIVTVCIILFIMAVIVIIVMRKARYGQFCCLKPKMRFRYVDEETGETREGDNQSPPTYTITEIDPPAYTDALHDVLVSQRTNTQETEQDTENKELVEVPLNENEDDQTPLNP